jgi:hypothetical protein
VQSVEDVRDEVERTENNAMGNQGSELDIKVEQEGLHFTGICYNEGYNEHDALFTWPCLLCTQRNYIAQPDVPGIDETMMAKHVGTDICFTEYYNNGGGSLGGEYFLFYISKANIYVLADFFKLMAMLAPVCRAFSFTDNTSFIEVMQIFASHCKLIIEDTAEKCEDTAEEWV